MALLVVVEVKVVPLQVYQEEVVPLQVCQEEVAAPQSFLRKRHRL